MTKWTSPTEQNIWKFTYKTKNILKTGRQYGKTSTHAETVPFDGDCFDYVNCTRRDEKKVNTIKRSLFAAHQPWRLSKHDRYSVL